MKYKHLQIFIGILALILIPVNTYYNGHVLVTISMFLIALGMAIQAFSLHRQEKKSNPAYIKTKMNMTNVIFFLLVLSLGSIGFFGIKNWWRFLIISVSSSIFFGIIWILRTNKKL